MLDVTGSGRNFDREVFAGVGAYIIGKLAKSAQLLDDRFLSIAPDILVIGGKGTSRKA
ncbi:MAG: hypothetical protein WCA20_18215 [Candidatus Sulfotelmatobacter sp.]